MYNTFDHDIDAIKTMHNYYYIILYVLYQFLYFLFTKVVRDSITCIVQNFYIVPTVRDTFLCCLSYNNCNNNVACAGHFYYQIIVQCKKLYSSSEGLELPKKKTTILFLWTLFDLGERITQSSVWPKFDFNPFVPEFFFRCF